MSLDTLDDPFANLEEEQDLESLIINRYKVSRPREGELLFQQLKSFNIGNILAFLFFFALGGFFVFLLIYYIVTEGWQVGLLLMVLFIAGGWVPAGIVFFDKFTSKRKILFTDIAYFKTNVFGKTTTFDRDSVLSVYIKQTTTREQGTGRLIGHRYDIKMNTKDNPEVDLFDIQMKSSLQGNDFQLREWAETDALRLSRLISEHWDIPVSVK